MYNKTIDKQIIYYYQRNVASYLIAKKLRLSNTYVRKVLVDNGVRLRGHNITNKVSALKRTPEENKKITEKASKANLGSTHTLLHRSKLANTREKNPTIDPAYEQPLVDLCRKLGIAVIPQKAFHKFNVDLYLPKENVVIEIFGGGFHNKKDAVDLFNNKIQYLSKKQIPVVIVWADKLTYNPKAIVEIATLASRGLTIITGDGKPTTRGMSDIILN